MNDRIGGEIPLNQLLIIAWGGVRAVVTPQRGDAPALVHRCAG